MRRWLFLILLLPAPLRAELPPLFARFSTDRSGLYTGEPFDLTLTVYVSGETLDKQVSISGLPPADRLRLTPFQELATETVTLEGRAYEARRFRCRARGLVDSPIVLAPSLQGTLVETVRSYFFVQRRQRPVGIPAEPLTLPLQPVPAAGRPAGFSGAVGSFTFRAAAAPLDVAIGDLVTVNMQIQGDELPPAFIPPAVPETAGLKTYEVKPVPEESTDTVRVYRQTVVPTETVAQSVPAVSFTYFDARSGNYRTLTAGPFPLTFHAERAPVQQVYIPTQHLTQASAPSPLPSTAISVPATGWNRPAARRMLAGEGHAIGGTNEITVRLAPSDSARPLFTIKPGASVAAEPAVGGWVRISCADGIGWVPEPSIKDQER